MFMSVLLLLSLSCSWVPCFCPLTSLTHRHLVPFFCFFCPLTLPFLILFIVSLCAPQTLGWFWRTNIFTFWLLLLFWLKHPDLIHIFSLLHVHPFYPDKQNIVWNAKTLNIPTAASSPSLKALTLEHTNFYAVVSAILLDIYPFPPFISFFSLYFWCPSYSRSCEPLASGLRFRPLPANFVPCLTVYFYFIFFITACTSYALWHH